MGKSNGLRRLQMRISRHHGIFILISKINNGLAKFVDKVTNLEEGISSRKAPARVVQIIAGTCGMLLTADFNSRFLD